MTTAIATRLGRIRLPQGLEWGILVLVLALAHVTFLYMDLPNTADNANIFIDSVLEGRPLDFYELSVERAVTNWSANYNLLVYVIFGLWQLPVHLILNTMDWPYAYCGPAMLWTKTLVLLFSLGVAWMVSKITCLCTDDPKMPRLAVFLYLSSMFSFFSVGLCGQLDAISTFAVLGGMYAYLKGNNRLFWVAFALAVPLKMFALLLALPLILLREKNLAKALVWWASMAVLIVVEKALFAGSPTYAYALGSQSRDAIAQLLDSSLYLGRDLVPFVACYLAIVLYAYIKHDAEARVVPYIGLVLWGTFVALTSINPYWVYLVSPYAAICICACGRFRKAAVLVDTIGPFSFFMHCCANGNAPFFWCNPVESLAAKLVGLTPDWSNRAYGDIVQWFERLGLAQYNAAFATIYATALIALMVLTCPRIQNGSEQEVGKALMVVRPVVLGLTIVIAAYPYLASTNPIAYDTREQPYRPCDVNLMSGDEPVVEQAIAFDDERNLDSLVLNFKNGRYERSNMSLVYVDLLDKEGTALFSDTIGGNYIDTDEDIHIDLRGTHVTPGTYTLRLHGRPSFAYFRESDTLVPRVVAVADSGLAPATADGKQLNGCLSLQIR